MTATTPTPDSSPPAAGLRDAGWADVAGRFFAASWAGMAVVDAETGQILDANPALCEFLGRSRDDLTGLTLRDITPEDDRETRAGEPPQPGHGAAAPIRHERRYLRGDGEVVRATVSVTPLPAVDGRRPLHVLHVEGIASAPRAGHDAAALPLAQRRLLDQAPAAAFIHPLDPGSPPFYVSPRIEAITGYRAEDLRTQRDFLLPHVHEDDAPAIAALSAETDRTLAPFVADYRFRRRDGRWIWLHNVTEVVRDEAGAPLYWQGYVEDVTARREAEDALRAAEARYRGLVEQVPAVVYTLPLDPEAPPLFVSSRIEALTGHTVPEVSRTRDFLRRFVHPEDLEANLPIAQDSDRTLLPCVMRYRIRHADGRWIWLFDSSEVVRDGHGEPLYWQGVLLDVTAEKALQDALSASEALFRSTFEDAAIGMAVVGPDARILDANPALQAMVGYTAEEMGGLTYHELSAPEFEAANAAEFARLAAGEIDAFRLEKRYRRKDGSAFWGSLNVSAVRDAEGRLLRAISQIEDITPAKEAELRYRRLVEQIPAAVFILPLDPGAPATFISPKIEELTGYRPEELPADREFLRPYSDPDDAAGNDPILAAAERAMEPFTIQYRLRRKDGRWIWLLDSVAVVRDDDGQPLHWQGVLLDVTAEKEAQQALAASERLFRTSFENAAIGMAISDGDGALTDANPAFCQLLGRSREELLALDFAAITHPDDLVREWAEIARMVAGESDAYRLEKRFLRENGEAVWTSLNASCVRGPDGGIVLGIAQVEDVSARKAAEQALAASEALFRSTFEAASVGMAVMAPDGVFLDVNPALCRIFGYDRSELVGRTGPEFMHPEDAVIDRPELARVWSGEIDAYGREKRFRHKDGRWIWVRATTSVLRDEDGAIVRGVGLAEDITGERAAEQALAESEALFRSTFEGAAIGMTIAAPDGRFLAVNPAFCEMLGHEADELVGRGFLDITHPDDIALSSEAAARMQAGATDRYQFEKRYLRKDGSPVWCRLSVSCVRDEKGRVGRLISQAEDISARKAAEAALAESEALFRSAFEDAAIGMGLTAPDGRTLAANPALCDMLGYTAEELQRLDFADFTHPDDIAPELDLFRRLVAGEIDTYRMEKRQIRKDGGIVWILLSVSAARGPDGALRRIIGQAEDITAARNAQDALAASEARFRATFEDAAIGMALAKQGGQLTDVNPAFCRLVGRTRDELLAMDFRRITHPDDLERELVEVARLRAGEIDHYNLQKRYLHKDGSAVWVNFNGSCVRGPDGGVALAIGQVEDISAVKAAQEALSASEELFRSAVHQSGIATGIADASGRFIDANDALSALTGFSQDELLGLTFADIGHPEDNAAERAMFREVLAGTRDQWVLEKRIVRKDGSVLWAWVSVSAVRGPDSSLQRLIGQVVDVTAIHEAQQAQARALDLQRRANDELRAATRQRAEFLAMLAHDFRSPLTAVQGYADLLLIDAEDPGNVRDYARTISGSAERLNRMVGDMLAVESMEARLGQLHLAATDVPALVAEAVSGLRGAWPGREIGIDAEPGLPETMLDRDQATQAVTNLVGNALKYSPAGEPVAVSVRQDGPAIEIAVSDRGMGIPADKLERVFDKYARIRTRETEGIEGVGLGLPIVRAVARAHGGDAWAESAPGEGSTFRLRLPLVPSVKGAPAS